MCDKRELEVSCFEYTGLGTPIRRGLAGISILKWSPSGDYFFTSKVYAKVAFTFSTRLICQSNQICVIYECVFFFVGMGLFIFGRQIHGHLNPGHHLADM